MSHVTLKYVSFGMVAKGRVIFPILNAHFMLQAHTMFEFFHSLDSCSLLKNFTAQSLSKRSIL